MESSSIVQEKSLNLNKTKLNINFCQIILKFESICFIISQLTKYNSKLKHSYISLKDHLKELTHVGLLREVENGVRSGKNYCTLYVKQLPEGFSNENIEIFSLKYLNQLKISWQTYMESCRQLILPSKFALLSNETSNILNNEVYIYIVQQHQITRTSTSTSNKTRTSTSTSNKTRTSTSTSNKTRTSTSTSNKTRTSTDKTKSKNNHRIKKMPTIENNQNSILKYFHPVISTTDDSSKRTNKNFSNIFNNHDDSQMVDISFSSSPHQSSNVIKSTTTSNIIQSKYFLDKIVQAPCPNTLLANQNNIYQEKYK